jgi:calcineurin-like phosphoesterase family protein
MENKLWFTGDLHYGHDNIIRYCDRPFKDSKEMNEVLINNWNSVVGKEDLIWVLGDFSLSRDQITINRILEKLNGYKNLIIGNHDSKACINSNHWDWVGNLTDIVWQKQNIVLCHYAMRVWNQSHRGSWMLYGHSHSALPEENVLSFDVGIDAWNYTPVSFDQIKRKIEDKKNAIIVGEKGNVNIRKQNQENNKKYLI